MHEMAITESIVEIVLSYAKQVDAKKVVEVKLQIGELRDIIDGLMEKCFRFVARDTVADEANLTIDKVPFVVRCNQCGHEAREDIKNYATMKCLKCGSSALKMASGNEFFVDEIKVV